MEQGQGNRWNGLLWIGGALLALLPFFVAIGFHGPRAFWVLEAGYFGDNMIRAIWWGLIGSSLGGLFSLKLSGRTMTGSFRRWCGQKHQFHWTWFIFSVGVLGLHSYIKLDGLPFTLIEKWSTMTGRLLTGAFIVGAYWAACGLSAGLAPTRMRRWPWVIPACLPFLVFLDGVAILAWKNPILNLLNQLDESGRFDLGASLVASGVAVPSWVVIAGFVLLVWGVYLICHWLADLKWASRLHSPRWLSLSLLLLLWGGVWAEKYAGTNWKSQDALRWEHNVYQTQLTRGLEPPIGVAKFEVEFFPKPLAPSSEEDLERGAAPDVFVIMLESLRQDAIASEHAPFLSRFRDEACQPLGETWASSNSTALSWYGLFHGALPLFWSADKAASVETGELALPVWFHLLKQVGYEMEVRTVCDLSYRNMGVTSFGSDPEILGVYQQSPEGEIHWKDYYEQIPQRESEAVVAALQSLEESSGSPKFQFIALDSTHYGYRWGKDFEPPYEDFYDRAGIPPFPDEEEIAAIKRRYYNSVAWVDSLVDQFVAELKAQGRYDNSLIIVTGDHGEEFQENGSWFHSSSLLPAQTQVPLFIKWPQGIEAPAQKSASHLDLYPSLRDLLGFPEDSSFLGRSLLKDQPEERTQVSFACNTGVTGVCMAWYRDGWTATFRWENPFSYEAPESIHLDSIRGPDGEEQTIVEPTEWKNLLLEKFPDAPSRLFSKFDLAEPVE